MAEIFTNPFVKSGRHSVIDRHAYAGGQPQAIDEERMKDSSDPLLQMDAATPPTKPIPWQEFPRCVYKHPKQPYKKIEHFNVHHELVRVETVPAEAQSKVVKDKKELDAALKDGWVKEPFVPQPLPDPNAELY